jgi:hypothetical protein
MSKLDDIAQEQSIALSRAELIEEKEEKLTFQVSDVGDSKLLVALFMVGACALLVAFWLFVAWRIFG